MFPMKKVLLARSIYLKTGVWPVWASWKLILWIKRLFRIS